MNHKDKINLTTTRDYILNSKRLQGKTDTNFFGNILIVGRTGCGKTFFTQKLAVNNFSGMLKKSNVYLVLN